MAVFTVGHSNQAQSELIALCRAHEIAALADVRLFPRSARWPQFHRGALAAALPPVGLGYYWLGRELGGRRAATEGAGEHTSLPKEWMRRYAAHMATAEFAAGIERLLELALDQRVALLCAEKDWQLCHRRLIADHLVLARGVEVFHVLDEGAAHPHPPDPRARLAGGRLIYDRGAQAQLF